jgi:hypothetical protein
MQQVQILRGYRSAATDEQYLAPGVHQVTDEVAAYLVENGHAKAIEVPHRPGRKQTRKVINGHTA